VKSDPKKRAARNAARRVMTALGLVKKGDGNDVNHIDRNVFNRALENLEVLPASVNRAQNRP